MHPQAATLWRYPRWTLAALLAGLGTLGPFAIDTYLPAFAGMALELQATPAQMQQTLSAYLFGFAAMNLFHGAISDSLGRRPVVLAGLALYTAASVGCALSDSISTLVAWRVLQGMTTGAGSVVARAMVRDIYPPDEAQRVMATVTLFFGLAPALAPLMGGLLFVHFGWHSIFWLLVAIGVLLLMLSARFLPETLHSSQRQPFELTSLLRGYRQLLGHRRFIALVLASSIPFNGSFLYVLAAPEWLGEHLHLPPQHFFWFFMLSIAGMMVGAAISGRLAGRMPPKRQVRHGFTVMALAGLANVLLNASFAPDPAWALLPVAVFSLGWALQAPVITLMVLDVVPDRRGMASSLQYCISSVGNGLVAGVLVPLVMHSALALALSALGLMLIGLVIWTWVRRQDEG